MDRFDWLDAAERAATHLCDSNIDADGGLKRIWLHGSSSIDGQLEDYANLALALLQLSDVTGKQEYLLRSSSLMKQALARFFDEEQDCFYLAPENTPGPQLIRSRNATDGAQVSPVAAALECMIGLNRRAALLPEADAAEFSGERIAACIRELAAAVNANPVGHPSLLRVIRAWQSGEIEPMQTAGEGRARVLARRSTRDGNHEAVIRLLIAPAWHVTAPDQAGGEFAPLSLSLDENEANWRLGEMRISGERGRLATPDGESVEILQGEVELRVALPKVQSAGSGKDEFAASTGLRLQVQLCDERSCQLPEILRFRL